MSVRDKAVQELASIMEQAPVSFSGLSDLVHIGGRVVPRDNYERHFSEKYEQLITSIDWNRVRLEAVSRCLKLHSKKFKDDIDIPCGECIEAALLVKETFPQW